MRAISSTASRLKSALASTVLLLGASTAFAQTVNLTAAPTQAVLPDGQVVPMWGYSCGAAVVGSTAATTASCAPTNPATIAGGLSAGNWSPVLITVPYSASGTTLTINLTNGLTFPAGTGANTIPTSLVIAGQLGGGLGNAPTTTLSPVHGPQGVTWFVAGAADTSTIVASVTVTNPGAGYTSAPSVTITGGAGTGATAVATVAGGAVTGIKLTSFGSGYTAPLTVTLTGGGTPTTAATASAGLGDPTSAGKPTFTPPSQPGRVQSFATEVAATGVAPIAPQVASGSALTWSNLKPGTYLIESGTHPSIQAPMGLYGILVVTDPTAKCAYPGATAGTCAVSYDADVPLLLSEIDPLQNRAVSAAVSTPGFAETNVWSGQPGMCGDLLPSLTAVAGVAGTCYPPAVNYSPAYYLVNGVSYDRTNVGASTFAAATPVAGTAVSPTVTGQVLVRFVNAGLRMHVPSIVNAALTLYAEDGNLAPGRPRVQSEVFLAAGKTYDVGIQAATATTPYAGTNYAVFDRQLSLSTNNSRDGGMQAYLTIAGGATTGVGSATGSGATLSASAKTFYCVTGTPLVVGDPSKGLLGGSSGANGVALVAGTLAPTTAALTLQSDGTFTYTPPATGTCAGSFNFTVNGVVATQYTATITECDYASVGTNGANSCHGGAPTAVADSYKSTVGAVGTLAGHLHVGSPGVLANDTDPMGLTLSTTTPTPTCSGAAIAATTTSPAVAAGTGTCTVALNPDGSFTATATASGGYAFSYAIKNSQGTPGTATATASLNVLAASNLVVTLLDGITGNPITSQDYRWLIEEDTTYYVDPACQVNSTDPAVRPSGCPPLPVGSLGYNFHSANMPVVATGCVGAVACESGQSIGGTPVACDQGNGVCTPAKAQRDPLDPSQVSLNPNKRYYLTVMPADGINPTINGQGQPIATGAVDAAGNPILRPFQTVGLQNNLFSDSVGTGDCTSFAASATAPGNCGHTMGGAQISGQLVALDVAANGKSTVNIKLQRTPLPTAQITAFVFEDDSPLNGENDAGGPVGANGPAPNEPGIGNFNIELFDQAGGLGDNTGQPTYDMFNQPLTNSLAGMIDPMTGFNACPLTKKSDNIIGMIPVCPKYEDGVDGSGNPILSPLVGQAIIKNLYPGLYEIQAYPAADRIAAGEEWLQTNTLDGGKPHEAFVKPNEPGYFQEFGPGGFHVSIGFANPKIINARLASTCAAVAANGIANPCPASLYGQVTGTHMSRTPDQRTYSSGDYQMYNFSQCYVALSQPDADTFAFAKCDPDGKFSFAGIPEGDYMLSVFDQWNDIMLDGLVSTVCVGRHNTGTAGPGSACNSSGGVILGSSPTNPIVFPVTQWRTNLYTRTFIDVNGDGVSNLDAGGNPTEPGLALVSTNIRYRDGSFGFYNNTDLNGFAGWNEVFPFMNWLVAETTSTRFKVTGIHTVYDAGGQVDGTATCTANAPCGNSNIAAALANTVERVSLPAALRAPGSVYCSNADCTGQSVKDGGYLTGTPITNGSGPTGVALSTGRIDPPASWGNTMGFQGLLGQSVFMEFGMRPFAEANPASGAPAETGGIMGDVIYASTRPFDDPGLRVHLQWEPGVPRVRVNLYQESTAADGEQTLKLVDSTTTTSWDDWAQGFRRDANGNPMTYTYTDAAGTSHTGYIPNMNCPGQDPGSPFYAVLAGSTQWLDDPSTHPAIPGKLPLAANAQFKCYDGWSQLNQVQPAPFDGRYTFPSLVNTDPVTGRPAGVGTAVSPSGGTIAGSNCTVCVANPVDGTPMLPAGKYVVEVILPQGFEIVKEEDKNILMGDIYVAPVNVQFPGIGGSVFIMPDQAAVNAAYNKNNPLNMTTDLGSKSFPRHEGDTGSIEAFWPCVGTKRIVPDYMSLFPGTSQNAPFAGATRALCDRKEVTLQPQSTALAKFYVFTAAHIAGHFTGTMTNDFASEFDPFSPQFGEKFGPPNLPVGMRDFSGNEMGRVYADQWGIYNGLYFSTWEVNPPNPTGYAPTMAIACMNDPGPIARRNAFGQYLNASGGIVATPDLADWITDPSYNPAYSNFCYEQPFMPGFTTYMDTPVIPTQAFADGYNLPDAEYPDQTPAIDSVIGDVQGPWVSATGRTITINCLGHNNTADPCSKPVQNPDFSGPGSSTPPYNQKTIVRHYGFGSAGTVTIAGVAATCSWGNVSITCTVPTIPATYNTTTEVGSTCASTANPGPGQTPRQATATTAQNAAYRCGELVITAANGKKSIDAVTVTVGGKPPTVLTPSTVIAANTYGAILPNPIQTAVDAAAPGDLIILAPGAYKEHVIMWKPVRLQGAGPGSVVLNADAHPAGSLDSWRRQIDCLFGLSTNGVPVSADTHESRFDAVYTCPATQFLRADRIPFEPIVGWDATGNGNLAQVLQEPTLMGAYEGAGVTVVGRGVKILASSNDFWGIQASIATGVAGAFPDGSVYLSTSDCTPPTGTVPTGRDYVTGNFKCNPSRIDGLSILNSSQGGGAVMMHGWAHNLEVANTRISANHGTLTGGISLGNGETPPLNVYDNTICGPLVPNPKPLCPPFVTGGAGAVAPGGAIPFQLNVNVRVHHNDIYNNASLGDALFSGTPSGAGAVTISSGAENYRLDHNWIAGNLSTGDGGGVEHSGLSFNGRIDHNYIVFNQSTNPTLPTNGGGLGVIGAANPRVYLSGPLAGQECGTLTDADCPPGLGDGTGDGLVIDANLILGNSAESGSGGGLRLQQVNGTEVTAFPRNADSQWYTVAVTNNIIANNVAGWDGAGVSLEDTLRASIINNTIVSNDTTASAGVLFKTLAAINASSPPPGCTPTTDPVNTQNSNCLIPNAAHIPQPAGLVTMKHTPNMVDAMNLVTPSSNGTIIRCPSGFGYVGPNGSDTLRDGNCRLLSLPLLVNNLFWQNRAFHVEISGAGTGLLTAQNLVALVPLLNQTATGQCTAGGLSADGSSQLATNYWDVGVRDDQVPNDGVGGAQLTLTNSILTPLGATLYNGTGNVYPTASPVVAQYCNGSRVPPENGGHGYQAPPGASETTGLASLFVFNNITPAATVDEGHNWINLTYGPLTLFSDANKAMLANASIGPALGAYSIPGTSPAVNAGVNVTGVPTRDYFGNARGTGSGNGGVDIGAVEYQSGTVQPAIAVVSPSPLAFGQIATSTTATKTLTLANNGAAAMTGITIAVTGTSFSRVAGGCGATLAANANCAITVQYTAPATVNVVATGQVTITGSVAVINAPVTLTATSATPTRSAQIGPTPLAFGSWAAGTTSSTLALNVVNTGNTTLTGLGFAFGGGTPQPFARNGGSCGATLAVGATCTYLVRFAPTAALVTNPASVTARTLTVTAGGGATITHTDGTSGPIALTGTALAATARATVSMTPNPLTITLPPGVNALAGSVTITNTAGAGGAQLYITNVTASTPAGAGYNWSAGATAGPDTCTGATLAPGQSCVATGRFNVQGSPRNAAHPGSLNIIDNGVPGGIDAGTGLARANGQSFPTAAVGLQVAFRDGLNNVGCTGTDVTTLSFLDVSGPHPICIVNTATAGSVTLTGLPVVTNTFSAQFSIGTGSTCTGTTVLAPGASCRLVVNRARPTVAPFDATGNLTVNDTGAAGAPQVLRMLGN